MKKINSLLIALVLGSQTVNAQNVGLDPNYPILYDVTSAKFSRSGNLYRNYLGPNNSTNPNGPNSTTNYNITRYLPGGAIDNSFGNNGSLSPSVPISFEGEYGNDLYLSSGNKILKYNFDGTPNTGYGNNGQCVLNTSDTIYEIIVNNDQSLYVSTYSSVGSNFSLFKVLPSGIVDTVFVATGLVNKRFYLSKTNDNSVILYQATDNANEYKIIKYTSQGYLDMTFGSQGSILLPYIPTNIGGKPGIMVNSLNEIITLKGSILRKYKADGTKDYSFGNNGEFDSWSLSNAILGANIQSIIYDIDKNNKILLFAYTGDQRHFIARLNNDGTPDNTFNKNGTSTYYLGPIDLHFYWGILQSCISTDNDEYLCDVRQRKGLANYQNNVMKFTSHINSTLSTSEVDLNNVGVYPNPVSDVLNINLGSSEKLEKVNIYSIDGRLVFSGQEEKSNIKFLSSGNYMVEIKTNKNLYTRKIIKK